MTVLMREDVSWESMLIITQKGRAVIARSSSILVLAVYILIWFLFVF